MNEKDKKSLAQAAFKWAIVDRNIHTYKLIKDPTDIVVSSQGISKDYEFTAADSKVTILTPNEIQKKADKDGDFAYVVFDDGNGLYGSDAFKVGRSTATVSINIVWARSSETKEQGIIYRSGGGSGAQFKRQNGNWMFSHTDLMWIY